MTGRRRALTTRPRPSTSRRQLRPGPNTCCGKRGCPRCWPSSPRSSSSRHGETHVLLQETKGNNETMVKHHSETTLLSRSGKLATPVLIAAVAVAAAACSSGTNGSSSSSSSTAASPDAKAVSAVTVTMTNEGGKDTCKVDNG